MRLCALSILALLVAFIAGAQAGTPAAAVGQGLTSPGFETETPLWKFSGPDSAKRVGSEGPGEFAAYANAPGGSITVYPNRGEWMARLGTPKDVNSSQPSGINSVSQQFTPSSPTLTFAARLFSWETRPNTDLVSFSFKSNGGTVGTFQPFSFDKNGTPIVSCSGPANCEKPIDAGNNGDFLNSGWVIITVTGLPTDQQVTFTASVGSTQNNSKASWLYLDNANTPPIADFDFKYPLVSLSGGLAKTDPKGPLEGSPIQFKDKSTDPDAPDDKVVAWEWTVIGPNNVGSLSAPLLVQNPFFVPHNEGTFTVTLKVTDMFGATGTTTKTIPVLNAPPLVNALNVEALAGKAFPLTGRFTDAGWEDTHSATWALTSIPAAATPAATVVEDHAPALGTGKVTGTVTAPGTTKGTLTVSDNTTATDGSKTRSDDFTVTTLADTSSLLNHTEFTTARPVNVDGSYLGVLPSAGARSVYEIRWPGSTGNGPQDLPGGSEVLVNLKDLPADYDVVLVTVPPPGTPATAGYAFSGFAFSGYAFSDLPNLVSPYSAGYAFSGNGTAGYAFSGLQRSAYGEAGYAFSDAQQAGYAFSGYAFSGYAFSGYAFSDSGFGGDAFAPYAVAGYAFSPISQMGFTGLQSSNTSPSDVSLSELGLGAIPAGTSVVGYSANRGLDGETVLARIDQPGTKLYAIVVGANGAYSADPFRLDVEGSTTITAAALNSTNPTTKTAILSGPTCAPRTIASVLPAATPSVVNTVLTAPTTLFVTNQARLKDLNPADNWNGFVSSVQTLAGRGDVNGKIISVDSAPYAAWDNAPCSIEAANAVSDAVRARIQAELLANPTIQYVVILGDDDVVPFQRVPDQVSIGNERSYLSSSFLKQGTPLYASVAGGYNLTDDCNVDAQPTPWQGRELCIPDKVVSRMVETPTEIAGQARAFIASNGLLDGATEKTGVVSGYDFFTDGSAAVADALDHFLAPVFRLIRDDWTATELKCKVLGIGAGCAPSSIADANAHFTHYAGLSANGFKNGQFTDVVTSSDVKAAIAADINRLAGKLVYTIGCHAGFSAPDNAIYYDPNLGIDARLDFAQAFAQANAVYIASTGYGIGDDSGIAGTERLIVLYAQELAKGKSAGRALVDAKRYYLSSLPAASVYDEKSSINLTFYGLPMYSLGLPLLAQTSSLTANVEALTTGTTASQNFPVTLNTFGTTGSYYSVVGGDAAAPPYRPLQPRQVLPVAPAAAGPVHGILWTSGGFTDYIGFNPVISRPSVEWEKDPMEPQVCYQGFSPSEIFRVNTLDNQGQLEQSVVVTPGQFRCDLPVGSPAGTVVTGTQRIFSTLGWEMLRSDSFDVTPPSLTNLDMDTSGDVNLPLRLKIGALDPVVGLVQPSGINRIVILRMNSITKVVDKLADQPFLPATASGTFSVNIPNPGNDRLVIQIVDAAGNVGFYSAKGPGLRILNVDLGPDRLFFDNQPVAFTANVDQSVEAMVAPVSYFWDFGDGNTLTTQTNSVSHTFNTNALVYEVKVKVADSKGGIGVDRAIVRYYCTDPTGDATSDPTVALGQADFIGCAVSKPAAGKLTITLFTVATLESGPGTFPAKIRYSINIAAGSGSAKNLSYREGSVTGVRSLEVALSGNAVSFTFDLKDVGWTPGKTLNWYATTQGGIPGVQGAGSLDRMKDSGTFSYTP